MADPQNNGAVFQATANQNCLVGGTVGMDHDPDHGITSYGNAIAKTQGYACATSTAPAALYRNTFLPLVRTKIGGKIRVGEIDESLPSEVPSAWDVRPGSQQLGQTMD